MPIRLRITFSKTADMRFTGHLDLHRTWERTFRRAQLPLAYSQGFHPQPRINLAAALPLGFTSECEVGDFWLEDDVPLREVKDALHRALPPGIEVQKLEIIDPQTPTLQTQVRAADYIVTLLDPVGNIDERIVEVIAAEELPRQWRDKPYDLRPLILELSHLPSEGTGRTRLMMRLSALAGATGRPEEVLAQMGIAPEAALIHRAKIIFEDDSKGEEQ